MVTIARSAITAWPPLNCDLPGPSSSAGAARDDSRHGAPPHRTNARSALNKIALARLDGQYRAVCVPDDPLRDAADQHMPYAGIAMRADDDQIDLLGFRVAADFLPRNAQPDGTNRFRNIAKLSLGEVA